MLYHSAVVILFIWNSIQDIKYKSLRSRELVAGSALVLILLLADGICNGKVAGILLSQGGVPWRNVWGILPGVGLLALSRLMNGCIGKGDGYLLCISGLALGIKMNLSLLFYAVLFAGVVSAVLLLFRRVRKDTKLPFVPFLFGGYLLTVLQHV